ncbi:MAG: tRNA preQ1(34) S-adenosylmethionine ribosyltransferase-isomerase QueA [Ostreibacterium sp.]
MTLPTKNYTPLSYHLSDFDFDLPKSLIAQTPSEKRTQSRLLRVLGNQTFDDAIFSNIVDDFQAGEILVVNNTKVVPARLLGEKYSGGQLEIFVERIQSDKIALCMIRANRSPQVGSNVLVSGQTGTVTERQGVFFVIELQQGNWTGLMDEQGDIPLPPYISRKTTSDDLLRYQTVYAEKKGAVAAPTAGLHFDDELLIRLRHKGVQIVQITLHVGAGTFQPVKAEKLDGHQMHFELFNIPEATCRIVNQAKANNIRVTAVGTTSLRALESAAINGRLVVTDGDTNLFIRPGYRFEIVDRLITNFHLPKSSLMMLVSAFSGYHNIRQAYAIAKQYRFFSYGDAMLLKYNDNNNQ